ncbi:MAG: hypothetical protein ACI4J7_03605, partial [Ruminiclostridium sp.]
FEMKNINNKSIAAIIAAAILTAAFAGCGNSPVGTGENAQTAAVTENTSKPENTTSKEAAETSLTESSSTANNNAADASDLANADVFCFEFSIDNETYKFPFKYADMEKNGWKYKKDGGTEIVKANQYLIGPRVEKDDLSMTVQPLNLTDSDITASEANIGKVVLDSYYIKPEAHLVKYGAITLGASTMDDVISAFGEPSSTYESEKAPTITYKKETYATVKFCFDNTKGGALDKIEIQNFYEN